MLLLGHLSLCKLVIALNNTTMGNIFLIGFMGSGKTTYGRMIAARLGMNFMDLDCYIEKKYEKTINSLFKEWGEEKFRVVERVCLHEIGEVKNSLIATGGGTPCFYDNIEYMNGLGDTIYLRTSVPELLDRLKLLKGNRPLIKDKSDKELEKYISSMLDKREPFYMRAKYILETDDLNPSNLMESYYEMMSV